MSFNCSAESFVFSKQRSLRFYSYIRAEKGNQTWWEIAGRLALSPAVPSVVKQIATMKECLREFPT